MKYLKMAAVARASVVRSFNRLKKVASPSISSQQTIATKPCDVQVEEKLTHTGQKWDENDYRLARFIDKPKQINERFAIDLIAEVPPKSVQAKSVSCDGGGGPLGHPKVYINLDKPGNHTCGYCGLRFYKDPHNH